MRAVFPPNAVLKKAIIGATQFKYSWIWHGVCLSTIGDNTNIIIFHIAALVTFRFNNVFYALLIWACTAETAAFMSVRKKYCVGWRVERTVRGTQVNSAEK